MDDLRQAGSPHSHDIVSGAQHRAVVRRHRAHSPYGVQMAAYRYACNCILRFHACTGIHTHVKGV